MSAQDGGPAAWVVEVWHPSQGWVAQTRPANSSRTRFWDDWNEAQSESAAYAQDGHLSRVVALEPGDDAKPFPASAYAALGEAEYLRDERATLRREILTAIEAMAGAKTALAEFNDRDRALMLLNDALDALVPARAQPTREPEDAR